MSKMDNMRAMREARYESDRARAGSQARPKPHVAPEPTAPPKPAAAEAPPAGVAEPADDEQLCGHRNMSGRTCTREHGHAAKSHRYS